LHKTEQQLKGAIVSDTKEAVAEAAKYKYEKTDW
jgi:hypothetical protein